VIRYQLSADSCELELIGNMPLYEYECESCGARFEVIQKFSDHSVETCRTCGGKVRRLLSAPAIQFKGTGWYITDYARKGAGGEEKERAKEKEKDKDKAGAASTESSASSSAAPSTPASGSDAKSASSASPTPAAASPSATSSSDKK
jgi:putative FmdB family regulatory protein